MGRATAFRKILEGIAKDLVPEGAVRVVPGRRLSTPRALMPAPERPALPEGRAGRRSFALPAQERTVGQPFVATAGGTIVDRRALSRSVSRQRQARHVRGHRDYSGSSYFTDHQQAQRVLDQTHDGRATIVGVKGQDIVVRSPDVQGFNHNTLAGFLDQPTNLFFIKGSTSVSVVPMNPIWRPR